MASYAFWPIAAAVGVALIGCSASKPAPARFAPPFPETSARGEPILAAFEGRIPCHARACEKFKVALVFYGTAGAPAGTYWLGTVAVGDDSARVERQGAWTARRGVKDYPQAFVYVLDADAPDELRSFWRVNEDILLPLDEQSRPKPGNASWGNMLSRVSGPAAPSP